MPRMKSPATVLSGTGCNEVKSHPLTDSDKSAVLQDAWNRRGQQAEYLAAAKRTTLQKFGQSQHQVLTIMKRYL